jgi:predicted esterase
MNTLIDGHDALVGVGFDTDQDPATGAPALPGGGLGAADDPLGLELLLLIRSGSAVGEVRTWDGSALRPSATFDVRADRATQHLVAEAGPLLSRGVAVWNAVGVAGVIDPSGGSWIDGSLPIMDVAFVEAESPLTSTAESVQGRLPTQLGWQDQQQAEVLSGRLPVSRAVAEVRLGSDRNRVAKPAAPGFNTFLYRSRVDLGGGFEAGSGLGALSPSIFNGAFQPYVAGILSSTTSGAPVVLYLHGLGGNHLNMATYFDPSGGAPGPLDMNYDLSSSGAVVVFPMGRDIGGWSGGPSQQDALDALADARSRLGLDADRVVLTGNSAGGIGSFDMGARYPDRFTGVHSIVGHGSVHLENLTNVPVRFHNGLVDPVINVSSFQSTLDALEAAASVDYRGVLGNQRSHYTTALGQCWYLEMLGRKRAIDPGRVRYSVPAPLEVDASSVLRPNGAYWVSKLQPRDEAIGAVIDVTSHALPQRQLSETFEGVFHENVTHPEDYCGPTEDPTMRTLESWESWGRIFEPAAAHPVNAISLTLSGLDSATLDVKRMGLDPTKPLALDVAGDGDTQLRLMNLPNGRYDLKCEAGGVAHRARSGTLVLQGDWSGQRRCTITQR